MNLPTLVIITGASRGFGSALAIEFANQFKGTLHMVLAARTVHDLEKTKLSVQKAWETKDPNDLQLTLVEVDLQNLDQLDEACDKMHLSDSFKGVYSHGILFNNAANVGPVSTICNYSDLKALQLYMDFNITSTFWLSKRFLDIFTSPTQQKETTSILVNVSSKCAVTPFETMGVYCAAKAARNMMNQVISVEHSAFDHIKTLNYAPGVLDTAMQDDLREQEYLHPPTKEFFRTAKKDGTIIPPSASAKKCVDLVITGNFASGAHIDYWDV